MGKVTVQFLGSGDAFGSGGRFQTCILVSYENRHFLIDCGTSALISMKRFGVSPALIDAIFVTHLHGDHFGGLPFLILDAQFLSKRKKPLDILGPPGLGLRLHEAMEVLFPGSSATEQRFDIGLVELEERRATEIAAGPIVTAYRVSHESGAPSFALRVQCGDKVIAYSGDTEWDDTLIEVASDADLFICEAYFFDKRVRYHLDYESLRDHLDQLRCRRLILTHMNEDLLKRLSEGDAESAEDGKSITV